MVLAVSNEGEDKVAPYVETHGLPFPVACGSNTGGALGKLVGARGIPHSYLLDSGGGLLWDGHPSELTKAQIQGALKGVKKPAPNAGLAWRGDVQGAPAKALKAAATGSLGAAMRLLAKEDGDGAADLVEKLRAHIGMMREQIDDAVTRRDLKPAMAMLEVLSKELKGLAEGEAFTSRLKELRADPAVKQELAASKALDRALDVGHRRGMKNARKSLESVVKRFPGTKAADRARKIVAGL